MAAMEDNSSRASKTSDALKDKDEGHIVTEKEVDVAAQLSAGFDEDISHADALRIRRKIDWHLMPLMCLLYLMQFADKTTLGQSAVLGLTQSNHLTANQFNWLGTIFYLSYLAFEYPQNLALQHFPVGKWMSVNIFIWAVALCAHAACHSFGGLFAVRFILGICEGAITAGFLIVTSMFYTRAEQTLRVGYWFLMNGVAVIILGFVAFGVLHTHTNNFEPWQWLMIITGIITLLTAVAFWFLFPDSPTNAWFLSQDERRLAVLRIKVNQTGVENKHWKLDQFIETLVDPKTWMFALLAALSQIPNSLTNQRQLIVNMFGFNPLQTTLLGCVDGVVEIATIYSAVKAASYFRNSRAYVGALWAVPAMVGGILVITLPSHNKIGLLFSYWTALWAIACLPVMLGWMGTVTAGHTKRTTTNGIVLCGYAIGNAAGPFMWQARYRPRNHVPWAIIVACEGAFALLFVVIRFYLKRENRRRDEEAIAAAAGDGVAKGAAEAYEDVYVTVRDENGRTVLRKVDKAFLDLTDIQNREFRYVL